MKTTFQPSLTTILNRPAATPRFGNSPPKTGRGPWIVNYYPDTLKANKSEAEMLFRKAARDCNMANLQGFLNAGIEVDAQDFQGNTALTEAALHNGVTVVPVLYNHGANLNHPLPSGRTATMAAAYKGHKFPLEDLIRAGANLNVQDNHGYTAVMYAVRQGQLGSLKQLIDAKADLNLQDKGKGHTAAMLAVMNRNYEALRMLKDAGADMTLKSESGKTAADIAKKIRNRYALQILKG